MKVAAAEQSVLASSGIEQTGSFQIRTNAHAFKMLSSGLYSDKVRAVLREIGCNAMDAHVAAGAPDRPIRVKIPTRLDDQFYIQDWGPGLSHDDVMGLYSTYFASTKQDSNDFTGAFGLGSKSPFSYTDSFTVVSTHGGKKRTYALYIDNRGSPTISLISEEDADPDWASGLRVGFAVKPADFSAFEQKAREVFCWFRVAPEMKGITPIEPAAYKLREADFGIYPSVAAAGVAMGNVLYPLVASNINAKPLSGFGAVHSLCDFLPVFKGLVLHVPIGSVQVAASRESLQFDDDTVAYLRGRVETAVRAVGKSTLDACIKVRSGTWHEKLEGRASLSLSLPAEMRYYVAQFLELMGVDKGDAKEVQALIYESSLDWPADFGSKPTRAAWAIVDRNAKFQAVHGTNARILLEPRTAVVIGVRPFVIPRVRHAVKSGKYAQLLVARATKVNDVDDAAIEADARALAAALGGVPVIRSTDLEVPEQYLVRVKSKRRGKNWTPSLPDKAFTIVREAETKDGRLQDIDPLFVCTADQNSWGKTTRRVRVLTGGPLDNDHLMGRDEWDTLWSTYVGLVKKLQLKCPTSYALLTASEIRALRLEQLGWSNAWDAIRKCAESQELVDGVKNLVRSWSPAAPRATPTYRDGLITVFAHDCATLGDRSMAKTDSPAWKVLPDSVKAQIMSVANSKARADAAPPLVLAAYEQLRRKFPLAPAIQGKGVTLDDLEVQLRERYPRLQLFRQELCKDIPDNPDEAAAWLALAFSKEVT